MSQSETIFINSLHSCLVATDFIYVYLFETIFLPLLPLSHNFNHLPRRKHKTYQHGRPTTTMLEGARAAQTLCSRTFEPGEVFDQAW